MLTKHSKKSGSNGLVPIFTLHDMQQYWVSCPSPQLADLFDYGTAQAETRILTYVLDQTALGELFSNVDSSPINFRIYMAANPDIPYGSIEAGAPSFTPIIQLFNTNSPPSDISVNAKVPDSITSSISVLVRISNEKATEMITDWQEYLKANLPHLFESAGVRVDFTTFDASDSGEIRNVFNLPASNQALFLHLGYEIPTETDKPYGFRIILEILAEFDNNPALEIRKYYEFSNPCPPAC